MVVLQGHPEFPAPKSGGFGDDMDSDVYQMRVLETAFKQLLLKEGLRGKRIMIKDL